METLATCAFIREHCTLLVQGPPGVGKTHLVVALGVRAIEQGFSVAFYRLEELLHEMRKDATVSAQALKRKKYFNVSYLVVDEVGFEPMSQQDASLFFRLVSYRYRRGSTAITTNKGVKDWQGILVNSGTPPAVIARLNAAVNKALMTDKVRDSLAKLGTDVGGGTPEEFGALLRNETARWTKVIQDAGIKINDKS